MAFDITNFADEVSTDFNPIPSTTPPAAGIPKDAIGSQTDLAVAAAATTNSSIINAGTPLKTWKARVFLSGTAGVAAVTVKLQCSSSATFASDIVNLDVKEVAANVAGDLYSLYLFGVNEIVAGRQFARISFVAGAGTSATADIIFYAA